MDVLTPEVALVKLESHLLDMIDRLRDDDFDEWSEVLENASKLLSSHPAALSEQVLRVIKIQERM